MEFIQHCDSFSVIGHPYITFHVLDVIACIFKNKIGL